MSRALRARGDADDATAHLFKARWGHDYDLKGEHVAGVGAGASAIQFAPQIAPEGRQARPLPADAQDLPRGDPAARARRAADQQRRLPAREDLDARARGDGLDGLADEPRLGVQRRRVR